MEKIAIVGAGYVGLVSAACFAQKDNKVFVAERDERKIAALLRGEVPFYEPGLDILLKEGIAKNKLVFVRDVAEALIEEPTIIFSCVGTPPLEDGAPDLSFVWQVAADIGKHLTTDALVVNKSTVPVGTAEKVSQVIEQHLKARGAGIAVEVVSNPEFLKEGSALNDCLHPDRVVVGVRSKHAEKKLLKLYAPFLTRQDQFISMDPASAELTKYAANAMLATRISFMNQLALLADNVGADIAHVVRGIGSDVRIGASFLASGVGYGGSCFPKDVKGLVDIGKKYGVEMSLAATVDAINDAQRVYFAEQIIKYYGKQLSGKRVGVWGLAFKPETDDIRFAPSLDIIKALLAHGAQVCAYDPVASENVRSVLGKRITYAATARDALVGQDCLVVVTEWKEFLQYAPRDFTNLKDRVVFDGRNCFDPYAMSLAGISYVCIGRQSLSARLQQALPKNIAQAHDLVA